MAMDVIESALNRGQHAIAVALDISGAFNNVHTDAIASSFKSRGFNPKLVDGYEFFLRHRKSVMELNDIKETIFDKDGTPQGGIISVLG